MFIILITVKLTSRCMNFLCPRLFYICRYIYTLNNVDDHFSYYVDSL